MAVNSKIYDERFFKNTVELENPSAPAVAEILIKQFAPKSVIDIGCGVGIYLAELAKRRVEVTGYDGSPAALANALLKDKIHLHDLCQPLKLNRQFDLCLCLELAEHLPKTCAKNLISTLTSLSSSVVFTAATPGQAPKSLGHINEQPHRYWQKLFRQKGFLLNQSLTEKIRQQMVKENVIWWLPKNLMILQKL
jgi:2-polyprenyl-3-methyl-5-hydroxy-6-metoxy-1,4-benzoquinol methylase